MEAKDKLKEVAWGNAQRAEGINSVLANGDVLIYEISRSKSFALANINAVAQHFDPDVLPVRDGGGETFIAIENDWFLVTTILERGNLND